MDDGSSVGKSSVMSSHSSYSSSTQSSSTNSFQKSRSTASGVDAGSSMELLLSSIAGKKKKELEKIKQRKNFDVDYVGTGTFQVSQLNLLQKRSIELHLNIDAKLSARGLHHRSADYFKREVTQCSNLINLLMRSERKVGGKYMPSPQLFVPHFQRALAYERLNQIDKAIADYTFCITIDESSAAAYFNRAGLYKLLKQMPEAVADMNRAVTLDPSNIDYRNGRSLLFREHGYYIEAISDTLLSRAIEKQPGIAKTLEAGGEVRLDGDLQYSKKVDEDPIIHALRIPCSLRKEDDLEPIIDFVKNAKFFSAFSANRSVIVQIAMKIEIVTVQKGRFVFQEGDLGDCFYVILEGEVSIIRERVVEGRNETITLVKMYRGQHFGETALETSGGLRSAGAIATQTARMLVLHAIDYQHILSQFKAVLKDEVKIALKTSFFFEGWEDEKIEYLSSFAASKHFGANNEILKAGEKVGQLFMIKSGIVKLIKKMPKQNTQAIRSETLKNAFDRSGAINEQGEESPGLWVLEKNWRNRIETDDASSMRLDEDEYTVGVLGSGQVFGELSVLDPSQESRVTAMSSTAVEVYCFDSEVLLAIGVRFQLATINALNESLTLHDPPPEKLAYFYRSKFIWELRKMKLISKLTK